MLQKKIILTHPTVSFPSENKQLEHLFKEQGISRELTIRPGGHDIMMNLFVMFWIMTHLAFFIYYFFCFWSNLVFFLSMITGLKKWVLYIYICNITLIAQQHLSQHLHTCAHDWLIMLWLTEKLKDAPPTLRAQVIYPWSPEFTQLWFHQNLHSLLVLQATWDGD